MNFLCNFPKRGLIFFSLTSSPVPQICGQFINSQLFVDPPPRLVHPVDYSPPAAYNEIRIDTRGNIYVASVNRVLRYDGIRWHYIAIPGETHLAVTESGAVYAAGYNILGMLSNDPGGKPVFNDLLKDSADRAVPFGQVRKILTPGDRIFILAADRFYEWNGSALEQHLSKFTILDGFVVSNELYLQVSELGLLVSRGDSMAGLIPQKHLGGRRITAMFPFRNNTCLALAEEPGLRVISGNELRPVSFPDLSFTSAGSHLRSRILDEGMLVFFRGDDGLLIAVDEAAGSRLVRIPGRNLHSPVRDACYDGRGKLLLLHHDAVSSLELYRPLRKFNLGIGPSESVNDIILHGNSIYTATSSGVFIIRNYPVKDCRDSPLVRAAFDRYTGCTSLLPFGNTVLVASHEGIYGLSGTQPEMIREGRSSFLSRSYRDTAAIYAVLDNGFTALRCDREGVWQDIGSPEDFTPDCNSIFESRDGFLWAGTNQEGLFRVRIPSGYNTGIKFERFAGDKVGGLVKLFSAGGELFVSSGSGLFLYDPRVNDLVPHPAGDILDPGDLFINDLYADAAGLLYLCYRDKDQVRNGILITDLEDPEDRQIDSIDLRTLDRIPVNALYAGKEHIWLATAEGLLEIDRSLAGPKASPYRTFIDRVIAGGDLIAGRHFIEKLYAGNAGRDGKRDEKPIISHSQNTVRFEYGCTEFNPEFPVRYQYRLKGEKDEWTEWDEHAVATFSGLGMGGYSFSVRSKDQYGRVSEPARFDFRIGSPLYLSWWAMIIYLILLLPLLYLLNRWRSYQQIIRQFRTEEIIKERTEYLLREKEKTENLLAKILPKQTADELKQTGKATTRKFKMVTVLFSDIQGFTRIAEQMNPDKLIDELDSFYFHFDTVVEKYNIEKIKTIGDAYMAAGGIPLKNRTNPVEVVLAALEMQHYMRELKKTNVEIWDLRIGVHTGSVVAGVVGQKKYSYDIWGDTVNTASRMESSGEPGKVNISESTHELVKDFFDCEYRGKMPVKYKGDLDMYFVKGLKPELQAENEYIGNEQLLVRLQLLRLLDLEEHVLTRLEKETPEYLFYHNADHTHHVYTQVELLGRSEGVSNEDLLILRTAALLHDIGYLKDFENHEQESVVTAHELLPVYQYSENHIQRVCELILATKPPFKPKNLLEEIICDANLDHLGRVDFLILSDRLFQEYRTKNLFKSKKEWNQHQMEFLRNHEFYTVAANRLREVSKKDQIDNIRQFS